MRRVVPFAAHKGAALRRMKPFGPESGAFMRRVVLFAAHKGAVVRKRGESFDVETAGFLIGDILLDFDR